MSRNDMVPVDASEEDLVAAFGEDAYMIIASRRFLNLSTDPATGMTLCPPHWLDWYHQRIDSRTVVERDNAARS